MTRTCLLINLILNCSISLEYIIVLLRFFNFISYLKCQNISLTIKIQSSRCMFCLVWTQITFTPSKKGTKVTMSSSPPLFFQQVIKLYLSTDTERVTYYEWYCTFGTLYSQPNFFNNNGRFCSHYLFNKGIYPSRRGTCAHLKLCTAHSNSSNVMIHFYKLRIIANMEKMCGNYYFLWS